jgi:hypothetical protein
MWKNESWFLCDIHFTMVSIVCTVQLGEQLGMCLFNNSKGIIRSLLPTYEDNIDTTSLCTNMPFYGDYSIDPGQYHMIIIELPKVDEPIIGHLRYSVDNTSSKLNFNIKPSTEKMDIDKLKKMLLEEFQKIIADEDLKRKVIVENAITIFQNL